MLASYVDSSVHQLRPGQVVAYDYIHAGKTWQWTLGTVREIKDYTAVVQQWGLHTGDIDTLRSILLKEVDTENGRMKNYHDALAIARERLASLRRGNEDRVSQVRGHFDKARENVELIDEVSLRKVTAQAAPSPVAVAVLKAAWAVAKCDPTAVEFYEWADVQLEYRKTTALDEIAKTDVLAKSYPSAESLRQSLEQNPKLNYKAAARDSPVVASLHAWVTTALAYQQAYNLLAHDKRIEEQNDAIAAAIAGMKACRTKIAKLKDELSSKDAATVPGQVTSFTRTSVLVTIPLSAVISPVNVVSNVNECVLTKDEVEQISSDANLTRYTQKQKLAITTSKLLDQYAAATTTQIYATELEDRLFFMHHCTASALRDAQGAAAEAFQRLAVSLPELLAFRQKRHDARKARAAEPELADADGVEPSNRLTNSRSPAGRATPRGTASQQHKALDAAHQSIDPATIANEPLYAVTIDEYKAKDAASEKAMDEAERMADEVQRLAEELEQARAEADKQAQELQSVRHFADQLADELEAFRQKRHDARKARAAEPELADADGVEPSNRLTNSRSPAGRATPRGTASQQHKALDAAHQSIDPATIANEPLYAVTIDEYKAKDAASEKAMDEAERMADEVQRLAEELEQARAEADKLEEELEAFRQKRHDARKARAAEPELADADGVEPSNRLTNSRSPAGRATPRGTASQQHKALDAAHQSIDPATIANEPLYAVTIDEYKAKDAASEKAMDEAERMADEVQRLAEELEQARAEADKQARAAERAPLADQLADELEAFRQKRHDARKARAAEPELADADGVEPSNRLTNSRSPAGRATPRGTASQQHKALDAAHQSIDPATIANEPLYAVTIDEYKAKDAASEKAMDEAERMADEVQRLAEELEQARAEADKLEEELEAFRQKRHDARKARAAEPELADADGVEPSNRLTNSRSPAGRATPRGTASQQHKALDAAHQSIDPATIANEPLYAVTIDEYKAKDAASEKAMDEAERMADEVQRLAEELEQARAEADQAWRRELEAFRQKRHDARKARAAEPELADADGVEPSNRLTNSRSPAGRATPRGTASQQHKALDAAHQSIDPATIANEPLYAVTIDEYKAKDAASEKAMDEAERMADEVQRLAEELEQARAEADKLEEELEAFRQKRHDARKARAAEPELADADGVEPSNRLTNSRSPAGRATPRGTASQQHKALDAAHQSIDPATIANEPLYAVTIDEYKAKDAASEKAMDEAERMADEVQRLAEELEQARAEADKLEEELEAFRQKRHDARKARAAEPELADADGVEPSNRLTNSRSPAGRATPRGTASQQHKALDAAHQSIDPATIANEPLYAVTIDEYKAKDAASEKAMDEAERMADEVQRLAEELEQARAEADKLEEELEAFRQKRHDARKARAAEPELADADGVEPSNRLTNSRSPAGRATPRGTASQQHKALDAAHQSIDPATIANEPLYAVTIDEYKAKDAASEKAMDEAERMADEVQRLAEELEQARAEADKQAQELQSVRHFADQLADELEAFRQKRHDARKARAAEPELADADGVEPSNRLTNSRSPAGRATPRGTASQQHKALDAAHQSIDPATIANEPLYAVTIDEYKAKDAASEKAMDEAERMADEVQRLAEELEQARASRRRSQSVRIRRSARRSSRRSARSATTLGKHVPRSRNLRMPTVWSQATDSPTAAPPQAVPHHAAQHRSSTKPSTQLTSPSTPLPSPTSRCTPSPSTSTRPRTPQARRPWTRRSAWRTKCSGSPRNWSKRGQRPTSRRRSCNACATSQMGRLRMQE
ncbi:flagellar attachment zone protein, putative [Leishmania tarentolae]|uniref:Flagellar attachment zone protein, putative n=1 Tax=Leishmania tarentolae TaxID=5689 RepID=A0A640KX62_LEITA|nr:flagellar attachment zone protein, putative [Leishmania tarentolae]